MLFADIRTCDVLRSICSEHAKKSGQLCVAPKLESLFFEASPAQVLYTLEVSIFRDEILSRNREIFPDLMTATIIFMF